MTADWARLAEAAFELARECDFEFSDTHEELQALDDADPNCDAWQVICQAEQIEKIVDELAAELADGERLVRELERAANRKGVTS